VAASLLDPFASDTLGAAPSFGLIGLDAGGAAAAEAAATRPPDSAREIQDLAAELKGAVEADWISTVDPTWLQESSDAHAALAHDLEVGSSSMFEQTLL
jgi:hypothetical protein